MAVEIEDQQPSVRLSKVAVSETHGEDSPYFAGWKAYDENPYHELDNPLGVIQMGLAENQVSVCVYIYVCACAHKCLSQTVLQKFIDLEFACNSLFVFFLNRFHLIC
jgi:hypothetical protein